MVRQAIQIWPCWCLTPSEVFDLSKKRAGRPLSLTTQGWNEEELLLQNVTWGQVQCKKVMHIISLDHLPQTATLAFQKLLLTSDIYSVFVFRGWAGILKAPSKGIVHCQNICYSKANGVWDASWLSNYSWQSQSWEYNINWQKELDNLLPLFFLPYPNTSKKHHHKE